MPTPEARAGAVGSPLVVTGTPLVVSRSVGPLFGFVSLAFKLESVQPTGSWLDRGAARIVQEPAEGTGRALGVIGAGPQTVSLAAQCARVGRPLVALIPTAPGASTDASGWLDALGSRLLVVEADETTLRACAPSLLAQIGGRYGGSEDVEWRAGLREVQREVSKQCPPDAVLAIPALTGHEAAWLAEAAQEGRSAVPLPLDGLDSREQQTIHGVVGISGEFLDVPTVADGVARQPVSLREAVAAQRLLAREEGILTSPWGAAGLAALLRVVQEDRRATPRARRVPRNLSAVVIVTHELAAPSGPPLAPDAPARPVVTLGELQVALARLLAGSHSG